jgi:hypothetical protein
LLERRAEMKFKVVDDWIVEEGALVQELVL